MTSLASPANPRSDRRLVPVGATGWVALFVGLSVLVSTITRAVILVLARPGSGAIASTLAAFAVGAVFDLLAGLWLAAPLVAWFALLPSRRYATRTSRAFRRLALAALLGALLFVAAAEVMFFDEFDGRFNFVAVDYLIYPTEVVTNLRESYPVGSVIAAVVLAALAGTWLLRRVLARLDAAPPPSRRARLVGVAVYGTVLASLSTLVSPALARVSDDRALNELASNGWYTFVQALRGQDAPYDGLYATRADSVVFTRLHRALAEPASAGAGFRPGSTLRHVRALAPERRLNVVLVLEESLGAAFVGTLHPEGPAITPRFDSLAAEGTLLTHAYSTGNRTIRALEATTSGLPPLPGISVVRRPASVGLFTLPALLHARGYATGFVYGGRAMFDNMGAYMLANGMEHVVDQGDFPRGLFSTAWGVADEAIFDMTLHEADSLAARGRPFLLQVLTVSNHKPYTYPAGRIAADPAAHKRVHAVAYADWALGRFLREARTHAWFDQTIFVVMGDHGARVYGAAEIPLQSYEVPVLFYAPGVVPAGHRVPTLSSSLDVPPTILGLLGIEYESRFFGHDVLHDPPDGRALMTHNAELALLHGGRLAVLGLHGSGQLFAVDSADGTTPLAAPTPADFELLEQAIAYYQGADELYRSGEYGALVPTGTPRTVAGRGPSPCVLPVGHSVATDATPSATPRSARCATRVASGRRSRAGPRSP